jgi:hypothetical protein
MRHALYATWSLMRNRCENPEAHNWPHYGGRGVKVCDRWQSFAAFVADMGERPRGRTLDRIDNSKGYEPGNCRWATRRRQNLNQRPRTASRLQGVGWARRESAWRVRAWSEKGEVHLGYFDDFFEACCARKAAELRFNT